MRHPCLAGIPLSHHRFGLQVFVIRVIGNSPSACLLKSPFDDSFHACPAVLIRIILDCEARQCNIFEQPFEMQDVAETRKKICVD